MQYWKLPPKEKIYEAFSVLADQRYIMESDARAIVISSGGEKKYKVEWTEDNSDPGQAVSIISNDNASFWQGYTGYPIIAILMLNNRISFDKEVLVHFRGINWNTLNRQFKNNYAEAVGKILSEIDDKTIVEKIISEVGSIYKQLSALKLARPGNQGQGTNQDSA